MPELPDVTLYVEALRRSVAGQRLERVRIASPFLIRSVEPPVFALEGRALREVRRLGKRIVLGFEEDLFAVLHLMIAGRLRWEPPGAKAPGKIGLAAFAFERGALLLTEAGTKKRASLHVVRGEAALKAHDPGGLDVFALEAAAFAAALRRENRTLKRALANPRLFDGIGNAYGDEILHAAGLSPVALTGRLDDEACARLLKAARDVLGRGLERLRAEFGERFPGAGEITAFRPEFAVHGKYGKPCPACGTRVQRIRYAENETNYCPRCQTGGKLLADRSLSRLLKDDWPRTIEAWEEGQPAT
ncbi:MAG: formamidopyrimidine-DNA glycosylase [Planctomycetota bacterium]|nr:formamidopyrimidine-DNA glycosylase [Planctomycetota bacterium]